MPKSYTKDQLEAAVTAARRRHLSIAAASREFNVPKSTISDHVRNPDLQINQGRRKQLNEEEEEGLVQFILYMAGQGFPMTRTMIRCYIQEIFKRSGRPTTFNLEKGPNDAWFRRLKRDHPQLSKRLAENQDRARTRMSNTKVVADFFQFWKCVLDDLDVADKPEQIFNCDETGWSGRETARDKVLAAKQGHVFKQKVLTSDHITAHLCVSADGKFLPPMVIFKGGFPHRSYTDGIPGSWLFATSGSGYMDTALFNYWFEKSFIPNCGRARPVILIMDNHDSHISLPVIEAARANDVHLVGLPSHTTHILQPLDVHIIAPLKEKFSTLAMSIGFVSQGIVIGKARFPVILSHALDRITPATIKEGFRKSGIIPFNPDAIDKSQLVPATFVSETIENGREEDKEDEEPTRTCETCGQFLGTNPLVKRGIIPESLADVLVPPTSQSKPAAKKKKIVSTERVLSGDEMLKTLKEKEKLEKLKQEKALKRKEDMAIKKEQRLKEDEERKQRKADIKEKRIEKKRIEEEEKRAKRIMKDTERQKKTDAKEEKKRQKLIVNDAEEFAASLYICGICMNHGKREDERNGIFWYGCDNIDDCGRWFHEGCLSLIEKDSLKESLGKEDWFCKMCRPYLYEE